MNDKRLCVVGVNESIVKGGPVNRQDMLDFYDLAPPKCPNVRQHDQHLPT